MLILQRKGEKLKKKNLIHNAEVKKIRYKLYHKSSIHEKYIQEYQKIKTTDGGKSQDGFVLSSKVVQRLIAVINDLAQAATNRDGNIDLPII
jgi:hypothetical protein